VAVHGRIAPFIELGVGFHAQLAARDNVTIAGTLMGLRPDEARRRFPQVIGFAELEEFVNMPLANYSSGMQVRLAFSTSFQVDADVLLFKPVEIDLDGRAVSLDGVRLALTPKEYKVLQVLARHAGKVVTHHHLLNEIWGPDHAHDAHYLRMFIRKLRRKIEKDPSRPCILLTELGVGYRIAQPRAQTDTSPKF